ncbi:metal ABC transporter solute-binding protein, Zn/Mn family [Ferrimonas gelatinilytica]|uniref:Zinc ABC transporter substrate-binding protein n=1 Tax=Ferrimonas gelatinilytica TaxID=1255257 RepID=A0ABP9S7T4_9GAMM
MRISSKLWAAALMLLASPSVSALEIFACEPEYAALARELAPQAKIFSATTALQDPHQIQARPSLIARMRKADLVICAGADLEVGWLPMLQMKANNPQVRDGQPGIFYAADQVETLDQQTELDRSRGDVHAEGNPHLHFSPERVAQVAEALAQRLAQLVPEQASNFLARNEDFQSRWQDATQRWQQQAAPLRGQAVIAYHSSFRYLLDWLGMEQVGDLEPKPGLPPTSGHLASLLELTEQRPVMAILHAGYQDPRGANWLGTRSGVPVLALPFGPGDEIEDLFALYDAVLAALLAVAE